MRTIRIVALSIFGVIALWWLLGLAWLGGLVGCKPAPFPTDATWQDTEPVGMLRFAQAIPPEQDVMPARDPGILGWCYPSTEDGGPVSDCVVGSQSMEDCIMDPKRPPDALCMEF